MDRYIRIENGILDRYNTDKCIYVIRDKSISESKCRYVSYHWDNWRSYYLIDYQNCVLFSYNSAQSFISDLMKENLNYQDLIIELSPYYKDCRQANTIEELCDGFYLDLGGEFDDTYLRRKDKFEFLKPLALDYIRKGKEVNLYGFIKTSIGLFYEAKMNEKGDLELI